MQIFLIVTNAGRRRRRRGAFPENAPDMNLGEEAGRKGRRANDANNEPSPVYNIKGQCLLAMGLYRSLAFNMLACCVVSHELVFCHFISFSRPLQKPQMTDSESLA